MRYCRTMDQIECAMIRVVQILLVLVESHWLLLLGRAVASVLPVLRNGLLLLVRTARPRLRRVGIDQRYDIFHRPELVRDAGSHCRGNAQRLVDAAEIVVDEVKGQPRLLIANGRCPEPMRSARTHPDARTRCRLAAAVCTPPLPISVL